MTYREQDHPRSQQTGRFTSKTRNRSDTDLTGPASMVEQRLNRLAQSPTPGKRLKAATDPRLSAGTALRLIHDDPDTRITVAHFTPHIQVLETLAHDPHHRVREETAANPHATPQLLDQLAHDPDPMVRYVVSGQPQASDRTLAMLAHDPDTAVAEWASTSLKARTNRKPKKGA